MTLGTRWAAGGFAVVVLAVSMLGSARLLAAGSPPALAEETSRWGPLPDELAEVLEAKAAGYARRALGFTCIESRRRARYARGDARRVRERDLEYLLARDDAAPEGFRAVRTRPGSHGADEESVDLDVPEPYLFTQLFKPSIRSVLRFRVGAKHTTPWKLALPIDWLSSAPVIDRRRITEWSGHVEVEMVSGNLVEVRARPSLQDERIKAELERYLTAFRFMGFSFAPPPLGQELTVTFGFEHDGFSYPTRVELLTFRQVGPRDEQRVDVRREVIEYRDYRFFGTEVHDEIPPLLYEGPQPAPPESR